MKKVDELFINCTKITASEDLKVNQILAGVGKVKISANKSCNLFIEEPVRIFEKLNIVVASHVSIGAFSYIMSARIRIRTDIGRYCSIARDIVIGEPNHPVDWLSTSPFQYNWNEKWGWHDSLKNHKGIVIQTKDQGDIFGRRVSIGDDVWVGQGAQIMRGVKIGTGAIIAAGAVVTKDIPPYAIVGGVPARVIRYRFNEKTCARILESKWWEIHPKFLSDLNFSNIDAVLDQIDLIKSNQHEKLSRNYTNIVF